MGVCIYGYGRVWVGAFFSSDHVTYRREKRLRRKMLDQVYIALNLRPSSSHSEAGLDVLAPREARGRGWTTPEALGDASHCDFLAHEAVGLSGLEPSSTMHSNPLVDPFHLLHITL